MPRKVAEWIGKTDDAMPSPRVRQRIYDANEGICHICSLPIKTGETWHLDHVKALIEGGENRESNMKPAHAHCNLAKAKQETKRKAKVQRTRQKHTGARKPKGTIQSRGFEKTERKEKATLPPRRLYE